jgi:hypothetical protein
MNRQRTRLVHSPEKLAQIYARPHDSSSHVDHKLRVAVSINMARSIKDFFGTVADLSCGDATILKHIPCSDTVFGDFAPGYEYTGPLEETLSQIGSTDLYICTETIEHLDDPDLVLGMIREKTNWLLLSTPIDAWNDHNEEHYWAWSRRGVEQMLAIAGFSVHIFASLDFRPAGSQYCFGIWVAS